MVCSLNSDDYFESFFPLSYYARLPEVAFFSFLDDGFAQIFSQIVS